MLRFVEGSGCASNERLGQVSHGEFRVDAIRNVQKIEGVVSDRSSGHQKAWSNVIWNPDSFASEWKRIALLNVQPKRVVGFTEERRSMRGSNE